MSELIFIRACDKYNRRNYEIRNPEDLIEIAYEYPAGFYEDFDQWLEENFVSIIANEEYSTSSALLRMDETRYFSMYNEWLSREMDTAWNLLNTNEIYRDHWVTITPIGGEQCE